MTDFATYRQLDAYNWSLLKEGYRSMRHLDYRRTHEREDTGPMRFGRAVHTSVLEPDQFPREYTVWHGARRGKEWISFSLTAEDAGLTVLSSDEYATCLAVRDATRADPVAGPYLQLGLETEKTLEWVDAGTSLKLKSRLDLQGSGIVADLKTTRDAGPDEFAKTAARLKYVQQLSFYTRGAEAVTGTPHDAVIIAVESEAPHDVCVYTISEDDLWTAGQEIDDLLQRVAECERTGNWPGRFDTVQALSVPWWAFEDDGLIDGGMK